MGGKYFSTGEMWNNIYAACYQDTMLGERKYKEGWLYDYGKKEQVENKIIDLIRKATPLNLWDLRSKLYFTVLMVDKAGKNAFTHFNQQYRKLCNTPGFVPSDHTLLDMLSESFATTGEQVDVTPFIQLSGGHVTQVQHDHNIYSHAKAVYPLYQLVDNPQLEAVKDQLKVATNRLEEQELSVLALQLLQICLVYVNTLMIQQVLHEPIWLSRMKAEDFRALTPLIYAHVNPYGIFELDMETRLPIEVVA